MRSNSLAWLLAALLLPGAAFAGQLVGTNDLADAAVTTPKIADGAVTDAKISGIVSGWKLGAHVHSGADITDGTITDAKIAGPISASKIAGSIYAQVRVVHKGLADGITSFNSVAAAMASITDASATNPYVVWVMPGVYTESSVDTKAFVMLKGSGAEVTTITSAVRGFMWLRATVNVNTNDSPIEDLTIENTNADESVPLFVGPGLSLSLTRSRVLTSAATTRSFAVYLNAPGAFTIRDCEIRALGRASYALLAASGPTGPATSSVLRTSLYADGTDEAEAVSMYYGTAPIEIVDSTAMTAGTATLKYTVLFEGSPSMTLRNSAAIVSGAPGSSLACGLNGVMRAVNTQAIGPLYHPELIKRVGCYDENFDPL